MKALIGKGNTKLGRDIRTWSLPAVVSCPGRSEVCTARLYPGGPVRCYALRGRMSGQQGKYQTNFKLAKSKKFASWLIGAITEQKIKVMRLHVSGDFFSHDYAKAWLLAMKECCDTKFYFYTRSWREPGYTEIFTEMAQLSNVSAWFSTDKSTGHPSVIPKGVRVAYLAVDDDDSKSIDKRFVDLVFRDYPSRSTVLKSINGRPVCPHENGKDNHVTCTDCNLCIKPKQVDERQPAKVAGRFALSVV